MPQAGTHCRSCGFVHPHGTDCDDCRVMHRLNRQKPQLFSFTCDVCGDEHSLDVEAPEPDVRIVSWLFHAGAAASS